MGLGASGCMQARVQVAGRRAGCPQIPLLRGPLSPRSPWCLILQRSGREPSLRFRNPVARCLRIERLLRLPGRDHRRSVGGHPGSSVVLAALPIPRPGRTTSARMFPTRGTLGPAGGRFARHAMVVPVGAAWPGYRESGTANGSITCCAPSWHGRPRDLVVGLRARDPCRPASPAKTFRGRHGDRLEALAW